MRGKGNEIVKAELVDKSNLEQVFVWCVSLPFTYFCYRSKYKTASVLVYEELFWEP